MLCTNRQSDIIPSLTLSICSSSIDFVVNVKYLGVQHGCTFRNIFMNYSNMNFSEHIRYLSGKLSKLVGIYYRIHSFVPEDVLTNLYYSLFYPHIIYCIHVWGQAPESHINPIIILQKKIIRIITSSNYLVHSTPLFYKTKILKICDVFKFVVATHMYTV